VVFGIELDPLYVDTAIRRWQRLTGEAAIHVKSGRTFDEVAGALEVTEKSNRSRETSIGQCHLFAFVRRPVRKAAQLRQARE
jgi:hypothetical protein